ncbi:MAG: cache domain-containing protein [Betaproteobacteria bacterium]
MTTIRLSQSIVTRLILVAVALMLIANAMRYFAFVSFMREDLTNVVSVELEALSRDMAHHVEYKIVERQKMLFKTALALPLDLLKQPDRLRDWLREYHDLNPLFSQDLFVAGLDGYSITNYRKIGGREEINYSDRDYFQGALAGEPTIGRPTTVSVTKEPILPFAVPIKDASGRVQAVLAGVTSLSPYCFHEAIHRGDIRTTGGCLLISPKEQTLIAATKPELILQPTGPPGVNLLHDRALAGFRGSGITVNAQGEEEIVAFASVPSTGWFMVARLPTQEAFVLLSHSKSFFLKTGLAPIEQLIQSS